MAGTPPDDPYDTPDDPYDEDVDVLYDAELDEEPGEGPVADGRPSPEVYRRRRVMAGIAALVAVALLVGLGVWIASLLGGGEDEPDGGASPTVATSPAAEPTEPPESSGPGASPSATQEASPTTSASAESATPTGTPQAQECAPQDLSVSGATDQTSYAADQEPVLELRIENVGEEPCEANVGTTQQVFTVTSGSDRIFSTEDCQVEGQDVQLMLEPGVQETARFTWDRTRSAPGCTEVSATPGPGTYRLEVALGEITAQPVAFTLQ